MSFLKKSKETNLGEYQKKKILADFNTFFDVGRLGKLKWETIEQLEKEILIITGWKTDTEWWNECQKMFKELWSVLLTNSTAKNPQEISSTEWLEAWKIAAIQKEDLENKKLATGSNSSSKQPSKNEKKAESSGKRNSSEEELEENKKNGETNEEEEEEIDPNEPIELPEFFPDWTKKYFEYKFRLLDRSNDGVIDEEEFEYILWDGFRVNPTDCRQSFKILSQDYEKTIDRRYFLELFIQFYFSDDTKAVGNYLNGTLIQ